MDENRKELQSEKQADGYGKQIEMFFEKMCYNEQQKGLFYLGRVLNQVAYAQYAKGHKSKPILNKLNYNGMDTAEILRLRTDLAEKAKQYNIVSKVDFTFSKFTDLFNPNDKNKCLSDTENVFYLLSGYSFGIKKDDSQTTEASTEEQVNE